ncbi:TPA: hypothetical protein N0F65_008584 [Lagenidium giganteum]|uniref:GPI inositol-deacylase n=1 Tax=Lagenidium giganteum TaxID=4803 RepID=A0AAV2YZL4_9STRA|nr:TPA: hypothetical protein N0F65_008584 [Lagenidium giganteum]
MIVELHGYTVLGSDPIRAPAIPDTPPLSCEPTTAPTQPIYPDDPSRHLRSCGSCADGKKKCLFFHGTGVKVDSKKLLTQYPLYWGSDILDSAPCCSSIRFARFNTYNTAWTDEILQTKFCNAMLNYDDDDTSPDETVVNDLIVVTHSMAGLVMGLALNSSRCELASSSKWVSIAAPMAGSNSADHISALCQQDDGSNSLSLTGQCPVAPTFNYFYKEGSPTAVDKGLDDYYAQAQDGFVQNVYAVMCGTSPFGLSSAYSPALALISSISKHSGDDDGLVEIASCSAGLDDARFSSSYTSRFYSASINHVDATFRNGDGFFGDGRKPLKWFSCLF